MNYFSENSPNQRGESLENGNHVHRRVLVVEDDADLREIYSAVLSHAGYRVDIAEDGEAGWQALQAESYEPDGYDLLITDNNMPKMSGIELIRKLRSERMILPVILASGSVPIQVEWLHQEPVLRKPFSPEELMQKVREVMQA